MPIPPEFIVFFQMHYRLSNMTSITRFQRKTDRRGAYKDLVDHNLGSSMWEKMVELVEEVLSQRTWNNKKSRYSLTIHI